MQVRNYLMSVITAAILCGIVNTLIGKKSGYASVVRLISGICMMLTVISPMMKVRLTDFNSYIGSFSQQAEDAVSEGEQMANEELRTIIKSRTEAYILDKAVSLDLNVVVEVMLNNDIPPLPCAVRISGSASPYTKKALSKYIANDLGIAEEDQTWI